MDDYRQQLLFALRMRDVPGPRIGEAIAEVESHIADTGEDPIDAFGPPAEYAQRLAESLAQEEAAARRSARAWPPGRWVNIVVGLVAFAGAALAGTGLLHGAAGQTIAGLGLLAALVIWLVWRRDVDRIVDPRTGAALRVPAPRWVLAVLAISLLVLVGFAVLVRP